VFSPPTAYQLRRPPKLALRVFRVERLAQMVGRLLDFELQQYAVEQRELLAVHSLDFLVQDRLELFRRDRRRSITTFHTGIIPPQDQPDKSGRAPHSTAHFAFCFPREGPIS